ncbi:hypothetical protein JVU11DRAFT_4978 [Chiua virens]|nr:hypothetical protein JVU11DRAFT_4978 [Chiua virens]
MSESPRRLSFPSSSEEFALPSTKTNVLADDGSTSPLFLRFRRPSLLSKSSNYYAEKRIYSPLAISFTMPSSRRGSTNGEESESDRERMHTESSPSSSSGNPTPPIVMPNENDTEDTRDENDKAPLHPSTPPSGRNLNVLDESETLFSPPAVVPRRLTYPLKPPRILNLLSESRPEENEVKSEAAFQRLLASCSDLPLQPRVPRALSDRGRYPEEVGDEEVLGEGSLSDDDDVDAIFALDPQFEPTTTKPCTPAQSVNGDDPPTSLMGSPMITPMDVDAPLASPSITSTPASVQWRSTPPPTTSAVRSNKRKFDERYDPYPTSAKRRAVSPSISYLRESHPYPRTPSGRPSLPIPLSIPVPVSNSTASSPTITGYPFNYPNSRQDLQARYYVRFRDTDEGWTVREEKLKEREKASMV